MSFRFASSAEAWHVDTNLNATLAALPACGQKRPRIGGAPNLPKRLSDG